MRDELSRTGVPDSVTDDAVLILSELLSNAWRHGRPLRSDHGHETVRVAWHIDEYARLTVEVTDGGGPTRPVPANPSITARGGRGLNIITSLAEDWGVRDGTGEVTVWASLPAHEDLRRRVTLLSGLDPDPELDPDLDPNLDPDLDRGLGSDLGFADLDERA